MTYVQAIELIFAVAIFFVVVYLMIKRKSSATLSIIWITIALLAVIQGIFPQILNYICKWLGVDYQPTLVLVMAFGALLVISIYMSSELAVAQNKLRELAIHISLLNDEMYKLRSEKEELENDASLNESQSDNPD